MPRKVGVDYYRNMDLPLSQWPVQGKEVLCGSYRLVISAVTSELLDGQQMLLERAEAPEVTETLKDDARSWDLYPRWQ
jgi:hypothetical protein